MSTPPSASRSPTSRQLRYLRQLAIDRGCTFVPPLTRAEASDQIFLLKSQPRSSEVELYIDRIEVGQQMNRRGDNARIRRDEVTGYGANCTGNRDEPPMRSEF